jgi:hypothetical protein
MYIIKYYVVNYYMNPDNKNTDNKKHVRLISKVLDRYLLLLYHSFSQLKFFNSSMFHYNICFTATDHEIMVVNKIFDDITRCTQGKCVNMN